MAAGQNDRAVEALDMCQSVMLDRNYPYETVPLGFTTNDYYVMDIVSKYYALGQKDKADALAGAFADELQTAANFYLQFYDVAEEDFGTVASYIYSLADVVKKGGNAKLSDSIENRFLALVGKASGTSEPSPKDTTESAPQDTASGTVIN